MTRPAMTMGRTGRKMVTQHGSFGKRALARKSSSDAIADDEVDSYAEIVYELYGEGKTGKVRSVQVPSGLLLEIQLSEQLDHTVLLIRLQVKQEKVVLARRTLPIWGLGNRVNMCTARPTRRYIGMARRNVSREQRMSHRSDSMEWS